MGTKDTFYGENEGNLGFNPVGITAAVEAAIAVGAFTGVSLSNRDEATGKQNGSFIYSREYR